MLVGERLTQELNLEQEMIEREVRAEVDKTLELGDGDVCVGMVRAVEAGVLDSPFYPWRPLHQKVRTIKDRMKAARYLDYLGKEINLASLYQEMTMDGRFGEDDGDAAAGAILEQSSNLSHVSWEDQKEKGFVRYQNLGLSPLSIGNAGDLKEDEPFIPLTHHIDGKQPYPTQTRRIQFYLDHHLYLAEGFFQKVGRYIIQGFHFHFCGLCEVAHIIRAAPNNQLIIRFQPKGGIGNTDVLTIPDHRTDCKLIQSW